MIVKKNQSPGWLVGIATCAVAFSAAACGPRDEEASTDTSALEGDTAAMPAVAAPMPGGDTIPQIGVDTATPPIVPPRKTTTPPRDTGKRNPLTEQPHKSDPQPPPRAPTVP